MERLTNIGSNGELWITDNDETRRYGRKETAYKRLAEYEDAEEQGLLLRLPCKVGDTVWVVTSPFNVFEDIEHSENLRDECYEAFISSVTLYRDSVQYRISAKVTNHFIGSYYNEQSFGKTVFLTKEEAEQKLKEMEDK